MKTRSDLVSIRAIGCWSRTLRGRAAGFVNRRRGLLAIGGLAWIVLAGAACGSHCPMDTDNQQPKALRISPGVLVKDFIESKCDREDWKDFSYFQDVRATVAFAFGEPYKPHGVTGEITLFSFDANVLQRQPIVPEKRDYTFVFTAQKDKDYFFQIRASGGAAAYMVETKVEPLDPCASCAAGTVCCRPTGLCCEAGTVCRGGACVRPDSCDPPCGPGYLCVSGQCEEACPGGCRKGFRCDEDSRTCIRERRGAERPAPPQPGPPATPKCAAGETYNPSTKQCEGGGAISGSVLSATVQGTYTEILINRGSSHGVRAGASGRVGSFDFTVESVSATRCRAKVRGASPDQLLGKSVRISP